MDTDHDPDSAPTPPLSLGVLDSLIGYRLRRANNAFGADFARAMAEDETGARDETGLRQALFGILSVVAANPGINQGATGRMLGIQRPNMVSLINELVASGLVERRTAEDDRRAFALTLTRQGEAMLATSLARIRTHEARMLDGLTGAEQRVLLALLTRIEARGGEG